jgi:demethylmenaquinone methyltransferase/2-methoxy-6-polyprenyl-1,4-benzoquinol methylase
MANLTGDERRKYVQGMFARIAPRYDRMNRLMTAGQDIRWRQEVIQRANLRFGDHMLDLGTGTGDLAAEALRQCPGCRVVAADFTLEMMQIGRTRQPSGIGWSAADALRLPFADESFEAVVSGFLLRNVSDLSLALAEQRRVLKAGGRLLVLDTTRPTQSLLTPLLNLYFNAGIPLLGKLLAGEREAYTYLPQSTQGFLSAEQLAVRMLEAGFRQVGFRRVMFGTIAIHWGIK